MFGIWAYFLCSCTKILPIKEEPVKQYLNEMCFMMQGSMEDLGPAVKKTKGKPSDRPHVCTECSSTFRKKSDLKRHERMHTGERPYKCSVCGQAFRQSSTLKAHQRKHTGECPFKCSICGKSFAHANILKTHLKSHSAKKPFECETCHSFFSKVSDLKRHKRTHFIEEFALKVNHDGSKSKKLPISAESSEPEQGHLGKVALIASSKATTIKSPGNQKETKARCSCGCLFDTSRQLKAHRRTTFCAQTHLCDICGVVFLDARTLKVHAKRHLGDKPFSCSICHSTFPEKSQLKKHEEIHSKVKSYSCSICQTTFSNFGNLKIHMRIHTGERPFACEICGRKFAHSQALTRHGKVHSKARPFTCPTCHSSFTRSGLLKKHLKSCGKQGSEHKKSETDKGKEVIDGELNFVLETGGDQEESGVHKSTEGPDSSSTLCLSSAQTISSEVASTSIPSFHSVNQVVTSESIHSEQGITSNTMDLLHSVPSVQCADVGVAPTSQPVSSTVNHSASIVSTSLSHSHTLVKNVSANAVSTSLSVPSPQLIPVDIPVTFPNSLLEVRNRVDVTSCTVSGTCEPRVHSAVEGLNPSTMCIQPELIATVSSQQVVLTHEKEPIAKTVWQKSLPIKTVALSTIESAPPHTAVPSETIGISSIDSRSQHSADANAESMNKSRTYPTPMLSQAVETTSHSSNAVAESMSESRTCRTAMLSQASGVSSVETTSHSANVIVEAMDKSRTYHAAMLSQPSVETSSHSTKVVALTTNELSITSLLSPPLSSISALAHMTDTWSEIYSVVRESGWSSTFGPKENTKTQEENGQWSNAALTKHENLSNTNIPGWNNSDLRTQNEPLGVTSPSSSCWQNHKACSQQNTSEWSAKSSQNFIEIASQNEHNLCMFSPSIPSHGGISTTCSSQPSYSHANFSSSTTEGFSPTLRSCHSIALQLQSTGGQTDQHEQILNLSNFSIDETPGQNSLSGNQSHRSGSLIPSQHGEKSFTQMLESPRLSAKMEKLLHLPETSENFQHFPTLDEILSESAQLLAECQTRVENARHPSTAESLNEGGKQERQSETCDPKLMPKVCPPPLASGMGVSGFSTFVCHGLDKLKPSHSDRDVLQLESLPLPPNSHAISGQNYGQCRGPMSGVPLCNVRNPRAGLEVESAAYSKGQPSCQILGEGRSTQRGLDLRNQDQCEPTAGQLITSHTLLSGVCTDRRHSILSQSGVGNEPREGRELAQSGVRGDARELAQSGVRSDAREMRELAQSGVRSDAREMRELAQSGMRSDAREMRELAQSGMRGDAREMRELAQSGMRGDVREKRELSQSGIQCKEREEKELPWAGIRDDAIERRELSQHSGMSHVKNIFESLTAPQCSIGELLVTSSDGSKSSKCSVGMTHVVRSGSGNRRESVQTSVSALNVTDKTETVPPSHFHDQTSYVQTSDSRLVEVRDRTLEEKTSCHRVLPVNKEVEGKESSYKSMDNRTCVRAPENQTSHTTACKNRVFVDRTIERNEISSQGIENVESGISCRSKSLNEVVENIAPDRDVEKRISPCQLDRKGADGKKIGAKIKAGNVNKEVFVCHNCGLTFSDKMSLKEHVTVHLGEDNAHTCAECGARFTQRNQLRRHELIHSVHRRHRCEECGATFTQKASLKAHRVSHTGERPYKCLECNVSYSRRGNLKYHMSHAHAHKSENDLNNPASEMGSRKRQENLTDNGKVNSQGQFNCSSCGKKFSSIVSLKSHVKVHKQQETFQCSQCDATFTLASVYHRHQQTHNKEAKKSTVCKFCGAEFSRRSNLNKHLLLHTGEKRFTCEVCGMSFTQKTNLQVHLRTHSGEKPYACNICDAKFAHSQALKTHLQFHSSDKTFACQLCGKAFVAQATLDKHMKSSHKKDVKEKALTCRVCGVKLSSSSSLSRHMRTHGEALPHQCSVCSQRFAQPAHLKTHMRTHNNTHMRSRKCQEKQSQQQEQ